LGACPAQDVLIGAVAAERLALELARQAIERPGRGVDHEHVVARVVERLGERRSDAAAADDDVLHRCSFPRPAPIDASIGVGSAGMGSRTTHTSHGACLRTYGIVRPMAKSPPNRLRYGS